MELKEFMKYVEESNAFTNEVYIELLSLFIEEASIAERKAIIDLFRNKRISSFEEWEKELDIDLSNCIGYVASQSDDQIRVLLEKRGITFKNVMNSFGQSRDEYLESMISVAQRYIEDDFDSYEEYIRSIINTKKRLAENTDLADTLYRKLSIELEVINTLIESQDMDIDDVDFSKFDDLF